MVKIAFVGSSTLNVVKVALTVADMLGRLPRDAIILLRKPAKGSPGSFETFMAGVCEVMHLQTEWLVPDMKIGGRESVYYRDYSIVEEADAVVALFDPDRVMEGGTGHVVEAALAKLVPVYAYTYGGKRLIRVGEHDPDDAFDPTRWDQHRALVPPEDEGTSVRQYSTDNASPNGVLGTTVRGGVAYRGTPTHSQS